MCVKDCYIVTSIKKQKKEILKMVSILAEARTFRSSNEFDETLDRLVGQTPEGYRFIDIKVTWCDTFGIVITRIEPFEDGRGKGD